MQELESYRLNDKRVETLERCHYESLQYNRRGSIEISGIPDTVPDKYWNIMNLHLIHEREPVPTIQISSFDT